MPLTSEQLQRLLDEPIYSWDVCNLLSGTVDFLAFSESNLVWQRRRELQRARERANALEFEPEDGHLLPQAREQIIESAELRFDIGLSQSVRYAGLISFVTAVEWCICACSRSAFPHPFPSSRKVRARLCIRSIISTVRSCIV